MSQTLLGARGIAVRKTVEAPALIDIYFLVGGTGYASKVNKFKK